MSEGTIEYEVTYPDIDDDNFLKGFLPSTMICHIKDDVFASELSSTFSQFKLCFSSDANTHRLNVVFKLNPDKLHAELTQKEVVELNAKEYGKTNVKFLSETKEIAGLKCKKAVFIADTANTPYKSYDVYYTEEIKIKEPNWTLPFSEIEGMPMEYEINRMGLRMKLVAKKVQQKEVDETIFQAPEGYKKASYNTIEEKLKSIVSNFFEQ